jgi:hypothetical protein
MILAAAITPASAVMLTLCLLLIPFVLFWIINPRPPSGP